MVHEAAVGCAQGGLSMELREEVFLSAGAAALRIRPHTKLLELPHRRVLPEAPAAASPRRLARRVGLCRRAGLFEVLGQS